jgi:hypothetical protein
MNNRTINIKQLLLYIPWLLSLIIPDPNYSYLIAWVGSFFIFYISMSGKIQPLPTDVSIYQQILRPLFLLQVIFCGYMACTSIFYFLDSLGYTYFKYTGTNNALSGASSQAIATCQQYYVLGHAALVHGILLAMHYPVKKEVTISIKRYSAFFIKVGVICLPLSFILSHVPGLNQFSKQAEGLSFVACTLALTTSVAEKNKTVIIVAGIFYLINFAKAAVSGFKEPVIISILLLGVFLLPVYGKKLIVVFVPLLVATFTILPTYVTTFRQASWAEGANADQAKEMAIKALQESDQVSQNNWQFLVNRISEISMFVQFREHVPSRHPYYGLQILEQSLIAIIPRVFWPGKASTEEVVMDRVYEANVVDPTSFISAKPAPVVDAYLSGGTLAVWISLLLYGLIAQAIAVKAEKIFGSFLLGTALVFTGLFQVFWRGNSFEFLINTIFYSYISMLLFQLILKKLDILTPVSHHSQPYASVHSTHGL